ncbi:MAG: lysophospholipid acyltransferase family protein [Desulfovermiculus sp.]|nr:lysophospholipid acyltransferase family protein [Desulfovermiculus sp.]
MQRFLVILKNIFFLPLALLITITIAAAVIVLGRIPGTSNLLQRLEKIWAKTLYWAGGLDIQADLARLDENQTYLFISNHQSLLDIPILLVLFDRWYPRFVAKKSLFTIPLFGPGMGRTGHLGVDRDNSRQGMRDMQEAVHRLQQGQSLVVFPEGTRGQGDGLQDFHIGAFVIALKAKVPMVPVIINGSSRVMPKGSFFVHPGTIRIRALSPRSVPEDATIKDRNRLKTAVWAEMDTTMREMEQWTMRSG